MQPQATNPASLDEEIDRLFRCYAPLVHRVALRILDEPTVAEDVVGEVFLRLASAKRRPERPGRNYFIIAARNEAFHVLKRSETWHTFVGTLGQVGSRSDPGPALDVELAEEREILRGLINRLPPRCREVIDLAVYDGLTQREVAERLRISIKAVQKQVTRAHRLLRQMSTERSYRFEEGRGGGGGVAG